MSCACIKKREFDLYVSHKGCETLVIEDQSNWMTDKGYVKPKTYDVTIKIPSRNYEQVFTLKTDGRNYLTSRELFGSSELQCLPDDIYCFSVESCGYDLIINRAYLCGLEVKLNELIYKFAETMTQEQRKVIVDTSLQLDSVKLNAQMGNVEIAQRLFKKVKDKLKEYHCDNC